MLQQHFLESIEQQDEQSSKTTLHEKLYSHSLTAVFHQPNKAMELKMIKIPEIKTGEVLIKMECATHCKSDIHAFCGKRLENLPTILGHEGVGRIMAFGTDTNRLDLRGQWLEINDRVTWSIFASNPMDENFSRGIPQKVQKLFTYGYEMLTSEETLHGTFSEYIILRPNTYIIKLDDSIPASTASIINCTVSTITGACRLANSLKNKHVLISGAGIMGLLASAIIKSQQPYSITIVDTLKERLINSKHFGADYSLLANEELPHTLNELYDSFNPFDVIIETSGTKAMIDTLDYLKTGGKAIWLGAVTPISSMPINAEKLIRNLITIQGLHNYNIQDFRKAVEFIEKYHRMYPFEELIQANFSLSQINESFQYAILNNPYKTGIYFPV